MSRRVRSLNVISDKSSLKLGESTFFRVAVWPRGDCRCDYSDSTVCRSEGKEYVLHFATAQTDQRVFCLVFFSSWDENPSVAPSLASASGLRRRLSFNKVTLKSLWSMKCESVNIFPTLLYPFSGWEAALLFFKSEDTLNIWGWGLFFSPRWPEGSSLW